MNLLTKILVGALVFLFVAFSAQSYLYKKSREIAKREMSNVKNLLKETNQELTLTKKEYLNADTEWREILDSVMVSYKLKLKQVKSATIIKYVYVDTTKHEATLGKPEIIPQTEDLERTTGQPLEPMPELYRIPASVDGNCWSMKGEIISHDPESKFYVLKKSANNGIQLLVTRKQFLGFLWVLKKSEKFNAYSDCGEIKFTKIDFTK